MSDFSILRMAYLERLGLVEDPFKQSADPRYLYLGEEHLSAYRQAQYVVARRRGLALITGAPGTGKTSLARRVFDICASEPDIDIAYIPRSSFSTKFTAVRTISQALSSLEVPQERSYEGQLEALKSSIVEAYRDNHNVVVIFDDAQDLSRPGMNLIHELYNFDYNEKTVQSLVFGQRETLDLFKHYPAVYSRMYVHLSLSPLSLPSAMQMIAFRLRTAGRTEPLIDDNAFTLLYDVTGGLPRDIVFLCSIATEILLERDQKVVNVEIMREAISIYEARK
jgi:general secretion pathway protein A